MSESLIVRWVLQGVPPEDGRPIAPLELRPQLSHSRDAILSVAGIPREWSTESLLAMTPSGIWRWAVPEQYGGLGAAWSEQIALLLRLSAKDAALATLVATNNLLGPVGVLRSHGSDVQRNRWLPDLSRGALLGAFALTEPASGSNVRECQSRLNGEGNALTLSGEKRFITNADYGRLAAVVCKQGEQFVIALARLPQSDNARFTLKRLPLHAQKHIPNNGLSFRDFPIDARDVIPLGGEWSPLVAALMRGRTSLCANASGKLRHFLAGSLAWAQSRLNHGRALAERTLIQTRLGQIASAVVVCDALATWCARLLDAGVDATLECQLAKVVSSNLLRKAAVEWVIPTQGARSFVVGNAWGDGLGDWLAPAIYEGENDLLTSALYQRLFDARSVRETGLRPQESSKFAKRRWLRRVWGRLAQVSQPLGPKPWRDMREPFAKRAELARAALHSISRVIQLAVCDEERRGKEDPSALRTGNLVQNAVATMILARFAAAQEDALTPLAALAACDGMLIPAARGEVASARAMESLRALGERIVQAQGGAFISETSSPPATNID